MQLRFTVFAVTAAVTRHIMSPSRNVPTSRFDRRDSGGQQTRPGLAGSVSELKPLGNQGDERRRSLPALLKLVSTPQIGFHSALVPAPPPTSIPSALLEENGNGRPTTPGLPIHLEQRTPQKPGIRRFVTSAIAICHFSPSEWVNLYSDLPATGVKRNVLPAPAPDCHRALLVDSAHDDDREGEYVWITK